MPIKAVSTTPVKKILDTADPSGESWVLVLPASQRHIEMRGQHLKDRLVSWDRDRRQVVNRINVNMAELWVEDLWILYGGAHIEIEDEDGTVSQPFLEPEQMSERAFKDAVGKLPNEVINEWHAKLTEVNDDWRFPF